MKIYQVGGSVRDDLLGEIYPNSYERDFHDYDYVVVGATTEEFLAKYPDANKIGALFPVFSVNGREYAFARREAKISNGHKGFQIESNPRITLKEDLARRDLTINAIAKDPETGEYIDYFGGVEDLKNKKIRHVTEAFGEDPLRVYRAARFAAKFPDFTVEPKTISLMNLLGRELDSLPVERVWRELERSLTNKKPSRFFEILKKAGVLGRHFEELEKMIKVPAGPLKYHPEGDSFAHTMEALDRLCDGKRRDSAVVFALLCHDFGKIATNPQNYPSHHGHETAALPIIAAFCSRLKIPKKYKKAAMIFAKHHMSIRNFKELRPKTAIFLLQKMETFPASFDEFLDLAEADGNQNVEEIRRFIKAVAPVLEMKLPERFRDMNKKSGEILLHLRIDKYKEIVKSIS